MTTTDDESGGSPSAPQELEVRSQDGKTIKIPVQRAAELAQRALTADAFEADLRQRDSKLRSDEAGYAEFQRLRDTLRGDPKARQAFELAISNPDAVLNGRGGRGEPAGEHEGGGAPAPAEQPSQEVVSELQGIKAVLHGMQAEKNAQALDAQLKAELGAYPWLQGKAVDAARREAMMTLATNPKLSVSAVAASAANSVREVLEESAQRTVTAAKSERSAGVVSLRGASPIPKLDTPPTAKDLFAGNIAGLAQDALRRLGKT